VFLVLNGVAATAVSNDDVYDLVMEVAAEDRTLQQVAGSLRRLSGL
jgi:prophage maintenance system killer protein